ncbi:MAG: hypothetical protein HQM06_15535 [Magnetococcales bacterium]|nr:hypothetical protein [Magnetococcales bacterium]
MLKSYEAIVDHGKIEWLSGPPHGNRFRAVVVVEQSVEVEHTPVKKNRIPPPELKDSVRCLGDILDPVISEDEWETSLERTARQIAGDPGAFK